MTIAPGESATQTFNVGRPGNWTVSDRMLQRYATDTAATDPAELHHRSARAGVEGELQRAGLPDQHHERHQGASRCGHRRHPGDLPAQRVRREQRLQDATRPGGCWPTTGPTSTTTASSGPTRTATAWSTTPTSRTSSNIDGFPDIDFKKSEMEQGEYERFFYHRPGSNILTGFINHPNQRMANGIFLGLQHSTPEPRDRSRPTSRSRSTTTRTSTGRG